MLNRRLSINFVAHGDDSLASHRMRVLKPAELLKRAGHEVTISDQPNKMAHWNIFGKHINNDLQSAKAMGGVTKVAFDIVDDHFEGKMGSYYQDMCTLADVILTPSENMKNLVEHYTFNPVEVVKEPITFPFYKVSGKRPCEANRLLWFGHASNLGPLVKDLEDIPSKYELEVITNGIIDGGEFTSLLWREGLVEERLLFADIVLLPIDLERRASIHKSTNRCVDALKAGKIVITNSPDVYGELEDYIVISDTVAQGLNWVENNFEKAVANAREGQLYVQDNYNDIEILKSWESVLNKYIDATPDFKFGTEINIVEGDNTHA